MKKLDTTKFHGKSAELLAHLSATVVNQAEASLEVTKLYQNHLAELSDSNRPLGNIMFLGSTGVGKTYLVEKFAEFVNLSKPSTAKNLLKIDCAEYQFGHEIAKLIGSPPGYLGHRETKALLTQEKLTSLGFPGVILFDEIDKAGDPFVTLLLGILDKATLTMGDNSVTNFANTFIFMTANLGAKELYQAQGYSTGFGKKRELSKEEIESLPLGALRNKFTPEFINRIDRVANFNPLSKKDYKSILEKEVLKVTSRINSVTKKCVLVNNDVIKFLIDQPLDDRYGARPIRGLVEKLILHPISMVIGVSGPKILVVMEKGKVEFYEDTTEKTKAVMETSA